MARPVRIEYSGAWYHVTCRGNEKTAIFGDDTDRITLLEILATSLELFHAELHAYVLMDNHFHIVLTTHEANLSKRRWVPSVLFEPFVKIIEFSLLIIVQFLSDPPEAVSYDCPDVGIGLCFDFMNPVM